MIVQPVMFCSYTCVALLLYKTFARAGGHGTERGECTSARVFAIEVRTGTVISLILVHDRNLLCMCQLLQRSLTVKS
jgi:hypothetical protein